MRQRAAYTIISRTGAAAESTRTRSSWPRTIDGSKNTATVRDLPQRRPVGEPGRDPRRLLRGEEMVRAVGLDLGDAFERVEQLVQVVGVPPRDEVVGVLGPRAGAHG